MVLQLDGQEVYRIGEALNQADVSRATYFRWVREGRIADTRYRDRNGRRVFTTEELDRLVAAANRLVEASPQITLGLGQSDREVLT